MRNVIFVALLGIALCLPLANLFAYRFVPGYEVEAFSDLKGASITLPHDVEAASFADGSLQDAAENLLSDWSVARDDLMLASKALERQGIATAAVAFGYEAYPTFFGSDVLEDPSAERLLDMPASRPNANASRTKLTRALNDAAERFPDVRFVVDFVVQPSQSAANPAYGLMGGDNLVDEGWVRQMCVDPLDDRIFAMLDSVDESAIDSGTFTTDHHWTLERALRSYNEIAEAWGLSLAEWDASHAVRVSSAWYGSYTRGGLDANFASELVDLDTDFSDLSFYTLSGHEEQDPSRCGLRDSFIASGRDGDLEHSRFASLYMDYYGEANSDIVNSGGGNGRTCLLVGDSFSLCLKRYIAANYARTVCILPGNEKAHKSLARYIEEYDVDDVIVMMHPQKSRFIASLSPKFLRVS